LAEEFQKVEALYLKGLEKLLKKDVLRYFQIIAELKKLLLERMQV
jgi:hypothetical protein